MRRAPAIYIPILLSCAVLCICAPQRTSARQRLGVPLADVNRDAASENFLFQARELARIRAYDRAANLYAGLLARDNFSVAEVDDLHHQPIWLLVNRDLLAWPPQALEEYRRLVTPRAEDQLRAATESGDLQALEAVAMRFMATEPGMKAMAMVAARAVENADFALALYYYRLLLDMDVELPVDRALIEQQAEKAAALSGIAAVRRVDPAPEKTSDSPADTDGDSATASAGSVAADGQQQAATDQPADQEQAEPPPPAIVLRSKKHLNADHSTSLAARLPGHIRWVHEIIGDEILGSRYPIVSTPLPYPVAHNGRVAFVYQTRAGLLDASDGRLIWQYDAMGLEPDEPPGQYRFEQAHRPIFVDDEVITPISRGQSLLIQSGVGAIVDVASLKVETGRPQWQWTPQADIAGFSLPGAETAPVISGHRVFSTVTTMVNFFGEVKLVAIDRADGKLLWQTIVGAHANQVLSDLRETSSMPMTTAVASRNGIVLTAGPGLLTAHSAISGRMLWSLQIPMMNSVRADRNSLKGFFGRTFRQQVNDRLPQLLTSDDLVFAGGPVDDALLCADLLSGRRLWMADTTTDSRVVALRDEAVITWGRTVASRAIADGRQHWQLELSDGEYVAAAPLVATNAIFVPTTRQLLMLETATGSTIASMAWPEGRLPGNLHLMPDGLLVGEPCAVVRYDFYDDAIKQMLARAKADKSKRAATVLELAEISIRVGKFDAGTDYLAQSIAAGKDDAETVRKAFIILRSLPQKMDPESLANLGPKLLDLMDKSAHGPVAEALQAMEAAAFYSASNPQMALQHLQTILTTPQLYAAEVDDVTFGKSTAAVLAEQQAMALVNKLKPEDRQQLLDALDEAARRSIEAIAESEQPADPAAIRAAALAHALSPAATTLLIQEAQLHTKAGNHQQAMQVLRQLLVAMEPGPDRASVRYSLANTLVRLKRHHAARFHCNALVRQADYSSDEDADQALKPLADQARKMLSKLPAPLAETTANAPTATADPPAGTLTQAWSLTLPGRYSVSSTPVVDLRSPKARAAQPILIGGVEGLFALHRDGRERPLWQADLGLSQLASPIIPMLLMDDLAIVGAFDRIIAIDPKNGQLRWTADLQPPVDLPPTGLIAAATYGHSIWPPHRRRVQALALEWFQGYIRVRTDYSVHLLDPQDGFSLVTIGHHDQPLEQLCTLPDQMLAAQSTGTLTRITSWDMARGEQAKNAFAGTARGSPSHALLAPGPGPDQALLTDPEGGTIIVTLADGEAVARSEDTPCPQRLPVAIVQQKLIMALPDGRLQALAADAEEPVWTISLTAHPADAAWQVVPLEEDMLVLSARFVARVSVDGKLLWRQNLPREARLHRMHCGKKRILLVGELRGPKVSQAFFEVLQADDGSSLGRTVVDVEMLTVGRFTCYLDEAGLTTIEGNVVRRWTPQK